MANFNNLIVGGTAKFLQDVKIAGLKATMEELSSLQGIESNVQTQLNGKAGKSVAGQSLETSSGTFKTAGDGAEIFNDYSTRVFDADGTGRHLGNVATGGNSHAEGQGTTATAAQSHAEGRWTLAKNNAAHAEGDTSTASGLASHAEGYNTVASGADSHAEGDSTTASGLASHAEGKSTKATATDSHAEGRETTASAWGAHAEGRKTTAKGDFSSAHGYNTTAQGYAQAVFGKYNTLYTGATSDTSATGSIFIVGIGTSDTARANALRITNAGAVMGCQSFTASGADYAEHYEWQDENPDNEDRRGHFVTFAEGNKIRIANAEDDYILGVVSVNPAVIGNGYTDNWQGMYLTDEYGERLTEIVEVEEYTDEETGEIIPAHTETRFIINPDYDPEQQYIGRNERKEWSTIGTHGQLVLIDDGTCEINHYCTVAKNGTATKTDAKTDYRVIERIDDTHIRIVIK
jgi:hypothetical protein